MHRTTYHLLLAERLTTYLTVHNLVDPTLQKAFLPGINGCIEHNIVMDEIIKDAKNRKLTCHITFFDLEDAFGSVPHSLIDLTLERYFVPPVIRKYFHNLCAWRQPEGWTCTQLHLHVEKL